jgi:hypothetical protein
MSEAHTADLGTRYRYRQEGRELERERIIKLLETQKVEFCLCSNCDTIQSSIELIKDWPK